MYRYTVGVIVALMLFSNYSYAEQKGDGKKREARHKISQGALKVGDEAPDFTVVRLIAIPVKAKADISEENISAKGKVTLSSLRGKKPVVIFFSSYT